MSGNEKILAANPGALGVIRYPDPRLKEVSTRIERPAAPEVRVLAERMIELMFADRGVGLAAPQVGVTVRMFIASPSFREDDVRVYVNPEITAVDGRQEGEEGCLSFPSISCKVRRYETATIRARDLEGELFEETGEALTARIFQHETDHLDGILLVDRMSSVARLSNRRALRQLQEEFAASR